MQWKERFKGAWNILLNRKQAAGMMSRMPGPQYPEHKYRAYAHEAYAKNELVYSCITELATSAPEAPLRVYRRSSDGEEEIPTHPLRRLIARPNPYMTEFELWEITLIHLYLSGNAVWEKVRSRSGQVVQLIPLRPDQVRIYPGTGERFIDRYGYVINGKEYPIDPNDIVHFKLPNPRDGAPAGIQYFGMPPLRPAVRAIAADNEATDYVTAMLQNSAVPSTIIFTQERLDEERRNRFTKKWKQKVGGRNRGEPVFMAQDAKVETLSHTLRDMEFPDLRTISESRICSVFGVPPILVGANVGLQRSTFSNYEEARRSFWQETIGPLQRRLRDRIMLELMPEFTEDLETVAMFDTSEVTALQESRNDRWTRANAAVQAGWATVNDARKEAGLDSVEGGDVFLRGLSLLPVPEGEEPTPPPPEPPPEEDEPSDEPSDEGIGSEETEERSLPSFRVDYKAWDRNLKARQIKSLTERGRISERFLSLWRNWAKNELTQQAKEIQEVFSNAQKDLSDDEYQEFLRQLEEIAQSWGPRMAETALAILLEEMGAAGESAAAEVGAPEFDIEDDLTVLAAQTLANRFTEQLGETSAEKVREIVSRGFTEGDSLQDIRDNLDREFAQWSTVRAEMVARTETIRAANMGTREAYRQAGVERMTWLAAEGDACPYCDELDGQSVRLDEAFVQEGETFQPANADAPLHMGLGDVEHPPAHPYCRCTILADV